MGKIKQLAMIEFPEEIQALRAYFPTAVEREQIAIFALNPEAYFQLKNDGFVLRAISPLTGVEAKDLAQRAENLMDECETRLFPSVRKYTPSILFFLRWPLTYQLYLERNLKLALTEFPDPELLGLNFPHRQRLDLLLNRTHNLHHDALKSAAQERGLRFRSLDIHTPLKTYLPGTVSRLLATFNHALLSVVLHLLRSKKVLFITSQKGNLQRLAQDEITVFLRNTNPTEQITWKEGVAAIYFNIIALFRAVIGIDMSLDITFLGSSSNELVLSEDCFEFSPILRKFLAPISKFIGRLNAVEKIFAGFLAASPPNSKTFMGVDNIGDNAIFGTLTRKYGQHSLLITHGSHALVSDAQVRHQLFRHAQTLFLGDQTHVAIQSRLAQFFFEAYTPEAKPVLTGPLCWGSEHPQKIDLHARLNLHPDTILVVHAGTPKYWPGIRFYMYEDLFGYIKSIADYIHAIEHSPNSFLIVRPRPNPMLSIQALRSFLPKSDRYAISTEGRLSDVVHSSDMLISYSSTTMEEALEYHKPVIQYSIGTDFCFLPALRTGKNSPAQRSAVYWTDDKRELANLIGFVAQEFRARPMQDGDLADYSIPRDARVLPKDFFR